MGYLRPSSDGLSPGASITSHQRGLALLQRSRRVARPRLSPATAESGSSLLKQRLGCDRHSHPWPAKPGVTDFVAGAVLPFTLALLPRCIASSGSSYVQHIFEGTYAIPARAGSKMRGTFEAPVTCRCRCCCAGSKRHRHYHKHPPLLGSAFPNYNLRAAHLANAELACAMVAHTPIGRLPRCGKSSLGIGPPSAWCRYQRQAHAQFHEPASPLLTGLCGTSRS